MNKCPEQDIKLVIKLSFIVAPASSQRKQIIYLLWYNIEKQATLQICKAATNNVLKVIIPTICCRHVMWTKPPRCSDGKPRNQPRPANLVRDNTPFTGSASEIKFSPALTSCRNLDAVFNKSSNLLVRFEWSSHYCSQRVSNNNCFHSGWWSFMFRHVRDSKNHMNCIIFRGFCCETTDWEICTRGSVRRFAREAEYFLWIIPGSVLYVGWNRDV